MDSDNWCFVDGVLHHVYIPQKRNMKSVNPTILQIAVPETLRQKIFQACHDQLGHWSVDKCYPTVVNHFYWPGLYTALRQYIKNCSQCNLASRSMPKTAPAKHMPLRGPFDEIVVDHIKLPVATDEMTGQSVSYALTIIDRCTQWCEIVPLPDCTAKTAALAIQRRWIPFYGMMRAIHSDLGSAWTNNLFRELCKIWNIDHSLASSQITAVWDARNMFINFCYRV